MDSILKDRNKILKILACAGAFIFAVICFLSVKLSALWFVVFILPLFLKKRFSFKDSIGTDLMLSLYSGLFTPYFASLLLLAVHPDVSSSWSFYAIIIRNGTDSILFETAVVMIFYFLLRVFLKNRKLSLCLTPLPFFILAVADYYIWSFRGNELIAFDFLSLKTALSVSGSYSFADPMPLLFLVAPYGYYILSIMTSDISNDLHKTSKRIAAGLSCVLAFLLISVFSYKLMDKDHTLRLWKNEGALRNGVIANFIMSFTTLDTSAPDGYSIIELNSIDISGYEGSSDRPNIIIIMNEAMTDPERSDTTGEDYDDPMPYYRSMNGQPNTIQGYALSSVYGGNTANSEFEMLTGLPTAFLPKGSIPYNLYLNEKTYSLAYMLKDKGYETVAMHPYPGEGWNRDKVYPLLGFDRSVFLYDMEITDDDYIRWFASDMCAYRNLIRVIDENEAKDSPLFAFMVTVQNHGDYSDPGDNMTVTEYLKGHDDLNLYLTLLKDSDDALEYLIEDLMGRDEKYIVLIFGDHHPRISELSEDMSSGGEAWVIPYMIWSNYDNELISRSAVTDGNGLTSINYIGLELLIDADIGLSDYFELIDSFRHEIPSINAAGYYSLSEGRYIDRDDKPSDKEKRYLELYDYLMYDSLFDREDSKFIQIDTE